ncbi:hypothetical protein D3C86_1194380 [compost metagenome]
MLDFGDGGLVERRYAPRQSIDEGIQFGIWQRAIHVAVLLGQRAVDIGATEQHLQRPPPPHQPWQARHGPASGHKTRANLELREHRLLPAGKPHVAGQRQFAAHARGTAADRRDGHHRGPAQADQHVGQRWHAGRPGRHAGGDLERRHEIVVGQEEARHGTIEHHHLQVRSAFELGHDLVQLRHGFRTIDIEWRMVDRDTPVGWCHARDVELLRHRCTLSRCLILEAIPGTGQAGCRVALAPVVAPPLGGSRA